MAANKFWAGDEKPKLGSSESCNPVPSEKRKFSIIDYSCDPATEKNCMEIRTTSHHSSPKKRLNINFVSKKAQVKDKPVFRHGNYSRYYGYRNTKDFHDVRIDAFKGHKELFADKDILDIGCNVGLLTMSIAKDFSIKHITGLDIDKSLINRARKFIQRRRKECKEEESVSMFPFNINFVHGDYVVRDSVLLDVEERYMFDIILCLSVTKWIHLNSGDSGLKLTFKRMYRQLKPGGLLILEPQPWESYKRRKKLTLEISENYENISFFPKDFTSFLLSDQVGFGEMYELQKPPHAKTGFNRPIQVFVKK